MQKFIFESVIRRPSTSVLWFDEYLVSINDANKKAIYDSWIQNQKEHFTSKGVNLVENKTDTELTYYVEFIVNSTEDSTGEEFEPVATEAHELVLQEMFQYYKTNGFFYRGGMKEEIAPGEFQTVTLESSAIQDEQSFIDSVWS
jgi:hypothetical protein